MSDAYHHGVKVTEISGGVRPIGTIATAIIGLVATSPDADAATFPLDTPVLVTDIYSAIGKAGEEGTLARALQAIVDQARAIVVVVRVAEGVDAEATDANVVGAYTGGAYTGMQCFLAAKSMLGVKPRILVAPGLDTQAVTTALAVIAPKLRGFAYAGCDAADTVAEAVTYRENFAARELMLLYPDFRAFDTISETTQDSWATARAAGLRARLDMEQGWHKSLSNVAVAGVTGISRAVFFDLQEPNTDAGVLNAGDITCLIQHNGFRFWGSRTCSDDPQFAFETATRTAQVLMDSIAEGCDWAVDKPLHPSLARDIIESINAKFRQLKAQGYIIDGSAWLDPTLNDQTSLAAGKLKIDYDYTPVPPLEQLGLRQHITDRYFADFANRVARA